MKFTESQLQAIAHNQGNLQIIACAGSGKTEVVARRVATLLKNGTANGLQPRNIVAFTFTEKAAAELKERIVTRCREELGEVYGLAEMFVGTIHAFCLELLKSEAPKNLNFTGVPLRRYRDPGHDLTELSIFREDDLDKENLSACTVMKGLDSYFDLLKEARYFDYSSIMKAAVDVLANDEGMRERLAARICHVIVDKFQDANPVQAAIVRCLHDLEVAVCVVGDGDQTIYQWRSDVENILTFSKRYPDVTQLRWVLNHEKL